MKERIIIYGMPAMLAISQLTLASLKLGGAITWGWPFILIPAFIWGAFFVLAVVIGLFLLIWF